MINPELDRLSRARYLSVTTYRRDGTPVATPVWVVSEGGYLQVVSDRDSGKVKRLRNNPAVALAPCSFSGELRGDEVPGTATIVDDPELLERVRQLVAGRYGLIGKLSIGWSRFRERDSVVLAIDVAEETTESTS